MHSQRPICKKIVPATYSGSGQCQGYAKYIGKQLTGVEPCGAAHDGYGNSVTPNKGWTMYSSVDAAGGLKVGDMIRIDTPEGGHAAIIYSVGTGSNPQITVTEKWGSNTTIHTGGDLNGTSSLRYLNQIKNHKVYYVLRYEAHTHSYAKTYQYNSYNTHTVTEKCSCGDTKTSTADCQFVTSGDKRVCSLCGEEGHPYGSNRVVALEEMNCLILPAQTNKLAVSLEGGKTVSGTNVCLSINTGASTQVFHLNSNSNGTYSICNWAGSPGTLVGLEAWLADNGINIAAKDYNRSHMINQWYIEKTPDGYYSFRNKYTNKYLDIYGGGTLVSGQNISQHLGNGSFNAQKFVLERVSGTAAMDLDANNGKIACEKDVFAHTGSAITPKCEVMRLVRQYEEIRVPESGVSPWTNCYRSTLEVEAGETYEIRIGSVERLGGDFTEVKVLAVDLENGAALASNDMLVFDVSSQPQSARLNAKSDGTILFYTAWPTGLAGTAALYSDVSICRVLEEGVDYELSYEDNVEVGTATVTATGKGGYRGSLSTTFEIVASGSGETPEPDPGTDPLTSPFSDVNERTYHAEAIWWLYDNGITTGFADGTFRPLDKIARCDMAAFLYRMDARLA